MAFARYLVKQSKKCPSLFANHQAILCRRSLSKYAELPLYAHAANISVTGNKVYVKWGDGHKNSYSFIWLQDHSFSALHATSKQRMWDTMSLKSNEPPSSIDVCDNQLVITWSFLNEPVVLPLLWLRSNSYGEIDLCNQRKTDKWFGTQNLTGKVEWINQRTWDSSSLQLQSFDARDTTTTTKRAALMALLQDGLVHLQNMPEDITELKSVFQQFGMIRRTFYADDVWKLEVVNADHVNDTAMTNIELPPHTDCTYHAIPPGLQLFSCRMNEAEGGESWFVDGRAVRSWH